MKALILLGTLKEKGPSNTAALSEFAVGYLKKEGIECEVLRLAAHNIPAPTLGLPRLMISPVSIKRYWRLICCCSPHQYGGTIIRLNYNV